VEAVVKQIGTLVSVIAWCALAIPALAQENCAAPGEELALRTAALQQQLMVAAFMCHDGPVYNRFVQVHRDELQGSDAVLKGYFVRHGNAPGYDTYKTRAANLSGLAQARNDQDFCAVAGQLFAAALETQAPLAAFVAAAPAAPGFTEVCVDRVREARKGGIAVQTAGSR
jgi:hypothetical protein